MSLQISLLSMTQLSELMGHSGKSLEDPDANRNANSKGLAENVSGGNYDYQRVGFNPLIFWQK